jgi:hypothetical protein
LISYKDQDRAEVRKGTRKFHERILVTQRQAETQHVTDRTMTEPTRLKGILLALPAMDDGQDRSNARCYG